MNLRDITDALKDRDMPKLRQAFSALVAYPDVERVQASSPGLLVVALNKVCAELDSDDAVMAGETCGALSLPPGSSYAHGVAVAYREKTRLSRVLIERFAA